MKSREELADAYVLERHGHQVFVNYQMIASKDGYLAGYTAATEQMQAEIDALKQEVVGGSWAFVRQIEDLQAKLAIAVEALERIADPRKLDNKEPDIYTELGWVNKIAGEALAKLGSGREGE